MRRLAGWVVATRLLPGNHVLVHVWHSKYGSFPGLWTVGGNRPPISSEKPVYT